MTTWFINKKNKCLGSSLIELIIYVGLLGVVLLVVAQLFVLVSAGKVSQITGDDINLSAQRIYQDISREIIASTTINSPTYQGQSNQLSLNGGNVVYQISDTNRLVKIISGQSSPITEAGIVVENLTFGLVGPSSTQSSLLVDYLLSKPSINSENHQIFHFAVTVR